MQRTTSSLLLGLVITLGLGAVLLVHAPDARACMTSEPECLQDADCPEGYVCFFGECHLEGCITNLCENEPAKVLSPTFTTELMFTGPHSASIKIPNYITTQLEPATSCVTALSPVSGVESVDSVINIDGRDDRPFEEVSFYYSSGPSLSIAQLAAQQGLVDEPTGEWHPFQSNITGTVRDGVPNYFLVNVTLEPGVSRGELLRALQREGFFLTSSSDPNGNPTPHHTSFRRLGAGHIVIREPEPTLSGPQTPRRRQQ